jgi:hypothetical protein
MKCKVYVSILAFVFLGISFLTGCSSSGPRAVTIASTTGGTQSATVTTAYSQLSVTVLTGSSATSGASVTFTAPTSGGSGTFANGTNTETDTTNSSGVATSSTFTANGTPGAFTVSAATSKATASADFSLTNTGGVYSFYLRGREVTHPEAVGPKFYAIAGSAVIDANGDVLYGEQDYNDGDGNTSPGDSDTPAIADTIAAGTGALVLTNGQGTLTLTTNNTNVGVAGVETLGVQFVNNNHALIIQFDGSATSSGSMDLQTLPSTFGGSYAFTLSGVDHDYEAVGLGGVFTTASGGTTLSGVFDENDAGTVTTGTAFPAGVAISTPDAYGRGIITGTGTGTPTTIAYYIIGPEAVRLIDVDATGSGVGSAFGQGTSNFSNTSLGSSVFGIDSSTWGYVYAAAGQFTVPASGTISGYADENQEGVVGSNAISGNYSISNTVGATTYNGYGNLTLTTGVEDVTAMGIYLTDPGLNLNDPNNTAGGGGALVVDLDGPLQGTGVLVPQTDNKPADFTGNYAFAAQDYWGCAGVCEFDLVGQGTVTAGVLAGTGLINDPRGFFGSSGQNAGVALAATPPPDTTNVGRYLPGPLAVTIGSNSAINLNVVIYQVSGTQLFLLNEGTDTIALGPIEQQGSLSGLAAVKRATLKTKTQHK